MPRILAALALLLFPLSAFAACPPQTSLPANTVCLEFQAPTQNVDGTPLTDLAGFWVYYGLESRNYLSPGIELPDPGATDVTLTTTGEIMVPSPGPEGGDVTLFFAMTAYDDDGNESSYSNEVTRTVTFPDTNPPGAPNLLNVIINVVFT